MNINKFVICIVCFSFFIFGNTHAYVLSTVTVYESSSSTGYSKVTNNVNFNQLMNLQNIKVKFTQDDNNYIFHIIGDSSINIYNDVVVTSVNSAPSSLAPMLYKTKNFGNNMYISENSTYPFYDYVGSVSSSATVRIGGNIVDYYEDKYSVDSSGNIKNYNSDTGGNGDKYFIPYTLRNGMSASSYNYRYSTNYPIISNNNGAGVTLLQNSSQCTLSYKDIMQDNNLCIDVCYFNVNAKIAIKKSNIDDYRHICFGQTFCVATSFNNSSLSTSLRGISICTQTIDLKEYVECEHSWEVHKVDKKNHYRCCEKCEWKITEPHELLYEYDGIKHNVCTCSYIEKVNYKFKINDDFTDEVVETFDTDAEYTKHEFRNKTGYKFKHYNIYEKRLLLDKNLSTTSNALKTVFVSTASELLDKTGYVSLVCEAEYEPNKFTVYYSNTNNKQLELGKSLDSQIIKYDEVANLRKNIHYVGYVFKGWSFAEGGENVDLAPLYEMTNYTAIDGYELKLYPVYANLDFKIVYSAGSGHFFDGSKFKEISYTYHDNKDLERVYLGDEEAYFQWYVDDSGNKFCSMADVKNYIERTGVENITLNLFPIFGRNEIGGPERTGGIEPGGGGAGTDESAGGGGGVGPGYDLLPSDSNETEEQTIDNIEMNSKYLYNIAPFSNSEIDNENNEEVVDKRDLKGAVVASLSFIIKRDMPSRISYSKREVLALFIKNNLLACAFGGITLLSLLVIYEIIVISRFMRSLRS